MLAVAEDEEMGGSMQLAAADVLEEEDMPRPEVRNALPCIFTIADTIADSFNEL